MTQSTSPLLQDSNQQLKKLMKQQLLHVERYINYLEDIKLSISANDSHKLQKLVENPPSDADEIELAQRQQQQLLAAEGYTDKESALDDFIQNSQKQEILSDVRQSLKQNLKQLEQSLFVNTLLLQKSQLRVKQSIRLLSGHDLTAVPSSYSREGSTDNATESKHIIAQA